MSRAAEWAALRRTAELQGGFFTLQQAAACGVSKQLLRHHALRGRVVRVFHRIYRFSDLPERDRRWMIPWLWCEGLGTFSHESALELHGLVPVRDEGPVHLTLLPDGPARRSPPAGVVVHRAPMAAHERTWIHGLAATSPERTRGDLGWGDDLDHPGKGPGAVRWG